MVPVYSPRNEMELINLRAILAGADIPFFIHNDHFGSMEVGPRIELLNAKTICVAERDAVWARELIDDYVAVTAAIPTTLSPWHVCRMIIETLCFNWCFPYRAHRDSGEDPA
jgi:hypothetical protein